jgi:CheY-like chemotaxis protein
MPPAKKPKARKRPRKVATRRGVSAAARNRRAVEAALAALAHDIRTPLTGILALSELLVASELGERERRWAEGVQSAAEHLTQLTTIVCDAVKEDAAGLALRQETFSPRALGETVGTALRARAEASGLSAEVAIAADLPPYVVGDPVRIRAALENLIDNAIKFTASGTVTLSATRAKARGKERLVFTVEDSGSGIAPGDVRKLFRPFSQLGGAKSDRFSGTGLGLSLVRRMARAMGGDLTVTSKRGRGSTFRLEVGVEAALAGKAPVDQSVADAQVRPLHILCVEDNPYGRVVLNTILKELGHHTDFASSGEAAVAAVAGGSYDVVLMDVTLTGIDGFEATRRIRRLPEPAGSIPIIGVSARSGTVDEAAALDAGMDGYLRKPVSPAVLAQEIGKARKPG